MPVEKFDFCAKVGIVLPNYEYLWQSTQNIGTHPPSSNYDNYENQFSTFSMEKEINRHFIFNKIQIHWKQTQNKNAPMTCAKIKL